jgi:hypothetical protein
MLRPMVLLFADQSCVGVLCCFDGCSRFTILEQVRAEVEAHLLSWERRAVEGNPPLLLGAVHAVTYVRRRNLLHSPCCWLHHPPGHFMGDRQWLPIEDSTRDLMAAVVGAQPEEVVCMNTLTVNLHLGMAAFYKPQGKNVYLIWEQCTVALFPSTALDVQIELWGLVASSTRQAQQDCGGATLLSIR